MAPIWGVPTSPHLAHAVKAASWARSVWRLPKRLYCSEEECRFTNCLRTVRDLSRNPADEQTHRSLAGLIDSQTRSQNSSCSPPPCLEPRMVRSDLENRFAARFIRSRYSTGYRDGAACRHSGRRTRADRRCERARIDSAVCRFENWKCSEKHRHSEAASRDGPRPESRSCFISTIAPRRGRRICSVTGPSFEMPMLSGKWPKTPDE
jgi:hypothetical protein